MLVRDVVIEYHGRTYTLGVLLAGSVQSKIGDRNLADRLEAAMDGKVQTIVLEDADAPAFYGAARTISVSLDRENLDWQAWLASRRAPDRVLARPAALALADPHRAQAVAGDEAHPPGSTRRTVCRSRQAT